MKYLKFIMTWFFTFIATRNIGSYKTKPKVNFYSRFSKNTFIGKNCHFNGLIIRGNGKVLIGDNFHSGKNILIITSNHKYDNANAIPYDTKEIINKDVIIEDNVWVGDRVIILGGVRIHEGVIIQAGAVVVNDIDAYSIVGGNPAKVFKHRNKDDYEKLKKEGKFC